MNFALRVQKLARFTEANKVTPQEYAENLFYSVAELGSVEIEDVEFVLRSIPTNALSTLRNHISTILTHDYRFPQLHYSGVGPPAEERERLRLRYQNQVKAFAERLAFGLLPTDHPELDDEP